MFFRFLTSMIFGFISLVSTAEPVEMKDIAQYAMAVVRNQRPPRLPADVAKRSSDFHKILGLPGGHRLRDFYHIGYGADGEHILLFARKLARERFRTEGAEGDGPWVTLTDKPEIVIAILASASPREYEEARQRLNPIRMTDKEKEDAALESVLRRRTTDLGEVVGQGIEHRIHTYTSDELSLRSSYVSSRYGEKLLLSEATLTRPRHLNVRTLKKLLGKIVVHRNTARNCAAGLTP